MEWDSDFIEVRIDGETILKALDSWREKWGKTSLGYFWPKDIGRFVKLILEFGVQQVFSFFYSRTYV